VESTRPIQILDGMRGKPVVLTGDVAILHVALALGDQARNLVVW
jgi:hypothetical protein